MNFFNTSASEAEKATQGYTLNETLLSVKDINLSYGNDQILSNINFEIRNISRPNIKQGQIVALAGVSGIGKTQLLRILAGFTPFGSDDKKKLTGQVLINKEQVPVKLRDVGVVSQNYKLFEWRTVKSNLLFTGAPINSIMEYCNDFDLTPHIDKYPNKLSGGQRQRTAILQQVLAGNKFIILDEPFSGLDYIMLRKTINLMLKVSLLDELNTLIIISHDLENSLAISDTAFLMTKEAGKGATIKEENKFDLMSMGLAWHDDIRDNPEFRKLLKLIQSRL